MNAWKGSTKGDGTRIWRLAGTSGVIQQFLGTGSFYGTWENDGGGRTGPVSSLVRCKEMVEARVNDRLPPNAVH